MNYCERYSWFRPVDDYCIAHDDGAVSLMIHTRGYDISMSSDQVIESCWGQLCVLLRSIDSSCYLETHYFREDDNSVAQDYLARNKDIVRAKKIGTQIRNDIAEHLSKYSRSNTQFFILTLPVKWRWWKGINGKLNEQDQAANHLLEVAERLLRFVPKGEIASISTYMKMICRSFYRDRWLKYQGLSIDHRFPINEQIVQSKPKNIGNGVLKVGDTYTKVGILTRYPDAEAGWFEQYAAISEVDVHISQIITPINTSLAMAQADQQVLAQEGLRGERGGEYTEEKISDIKQFKLFVAQNDLKLFQSCFIVHFHCTDPNILKRCWEHLEDGLGSGGRLIANEDIALAAFRFAQPGQGYRTSFMRPDHELEVANMMPLVVYDSGATYPDSLRLTQESQLVGLSYKDNDVNNAFTIAKSGGGKGVTKTATILETYPLGTDWYITEVGRTYQWPVEALGGTYCDLDPDKVVVNPLPEYAYANPNADWPFPHSVIAPTLNAISFLLLDDVRSYQAEELAAAEQAMQMLYLPFDDEPLPEQGSPNLEDYSTVLNDFAEERSFPEDQRRAAEKMAQKLNAFLSTGAGSNFIKADNFTISEGIFGVNFKPLLSDKKLMMFYLIFISLRFSQLCFANQRPSRILIDEMHVFSDTNPEMMKRLVSSISRMGRKESGAFDGVTQSLSDIAGLDPETLDQMTHRSLLYTQSRHDELLKSVPKISQRAFERWQSFPDPSSIDHMDYRQGIHMMGDRSWDLYLTFPESVMLLGNTDTDVLAMKDQIGQRVKDPFERLALLKETMKKSRQSKRAEKSKEVETYEAV